MKVYVIYTDSDVEEATLKVKAGHESLEELCHVIAEETYKRKTLHVTAGEEIYKINCKHVCYIESLNDKVWVHTNQRKFEHKKRLYELEQKLPEEFVRISKSVILNLEQVEHYSPQMNGVMRAVLKNGNAVYISRKYLKTLRDRIGGK